MHRSSPLRPRLVAAAATILVLSLLSTTASADLLRLRRLDTDEEGNFTVMFSVLGSNNDPIADPAQIPLAALRLNGGENQAELQTLELNDATLTTLRGYQRPFGIYVLLPDTDLFNGAEGIELRPDESQMRSALADALQTLSTERADITINIGRYNDSLTWLPEFNSTQLVELRSTLLSDQNAAPAGTRFEDPFAAVNQTRQTRLRRQAQDGDNFVYFLIIVTSALTQVDDPQEFNAQVAQLQERLSGRDMANVVTTTIIYNPYFDLPTLNDPGGESLRFAQGVTPASGTYRLTNSVQGIRSTFQQVVDEIGSSFILRFQNKELEGDINYNFQLEVTPSGGEQLTSNNMVAHVNKVPTNVMGLIILIGSIVIGVVLILILVIWLIKRPKKEPEAEEEVVLEKPPEQCVQCGRLLRDDLQYCPHCAAEPNYGLLRVIEGPHSGWTYFLRQTTTELSKGAPLHQGMIVLDQDPAISSKHLNISVQDGHRYLIEDLGSTNGTFIEGQRIEKQFLKNGDVIAMGTSTKIKFTIS